MVRDKELLASAKSGPRRQGKKELIKYLEGGKISRSQAVKAKCFDCDGMGDSGMCEIESCALYSYSPFKRGGYLKNKGWDSNSGVSEPKPDDFKGQNAKEGIVGEVSSA